ncbi:MAG: hypothetical protein Q7T56_10135 [Nocardioidaceae bacterium]|nr:hypothetical protein [Nocardioidaceae bacterium]
MSFQLIAWIMLCSGLVVVTRNRPVLTVSAALAVWFLVPAYAAQRVTGVDGGVLGLHPATWILLVALGVHLLVSPRQMSSPVAAHPYVVLAVVLLVAVGAATSVLTGSGGLALLADQVVGPVGAFWLVLAFAGHRDLLLLRGAVLGLVALQCLLALAQWRLGSLIFFTADAQVLYWFDPLTFTRWMGTTDSPLVMSLAICAATPLLAGLQRHSIRFALMGLFLGGCLVAQSRTGAALMVLLVLWVLLRTQMSVVLRLGYVMLMALAGGVVVRSALASGINDRVSDDSGSAQARGQAIEFFVSHWSNYAAVGHGLTSSYDIATLAGLITSLESSYLMYAVDCGIVAATLYFGAQGALILRHGVGARPLGVGLAALVACTLQHTFSGVATANLVGTLTWVLLAMTVAGRAVDPDVAEPVGTAEPAETAPVTAARS